MATYAQPGHYGPEALLVGGAPLLDATASAPAGYTAAIDSLGNLTVSGPPAQAVVITLTRTGGIVLPPLTVTVGPAVVDVQTVPDTVTSLATVTGAVAMAQGVADAAGSTATSALALAGTKRTASQVDAAIAAQATSDATTFLAKADAAVSYGALRTTVKTAAYTAAPGDLVPVDTTGGPVTITLPSAPAVGSIVHVKHIVQGGTNAVTVTCGGSDTFNRTGGATSMSFVLLAAGATYRYSAGGIWTVMEAAPPLSQFDARFASLVAGLVPAAQLGNAPDATVALLGATAGAPIMPWLTPPALGPELWALANFRAGYNVSTLTPSLTANSTAQTSRTLVGLGNVGNQDQAYRVTMDIASTVPSGWASVSLKLVDSTGTILAGSTEQRLSTAVSNPGSVVFDFKIGPWATTVTDLEVRIEFGNNATTGSVSLANVSVREIAAALHPILYTESHGGAPGYPEIHQPLFDPVAEKWRLAIHDLNADSVLTRAIRDIIGYNTDQPYVTNVTPDPSFLSPTLGIGAGMSPQIFLAAGEVGRSLRVQNNDQIFQVRKQDGTTYELRGNTHGGETLRSTAAPDLVYEVDRTGAGPWVAWDGLTKVLRACRRFRFTYNTKITRSAPDSDDVMNVNHVATYFGDGMMRMDRTTTFLKDLVLQNHFEWMSSHDLTSPKIGRIGRGLLVEDEVDVFPKVAAPAVPTPGTSTTGGTLPAATYGYTVTALSGAGETTPSPIVTQVTTGTTSTVTITWTAVTGATGYRIYGRANGTNQQSLLATVGPATLTFTDDGSLPVVPQRPVAANTARLLASVTTAQDSAVSDKATWAVWYDPILNMCFGNIYDRDAVAARTGIAGTKLRLERGSGIMKNYLNVYFTSDGTTAQTNSPQVQVRTIPSGTVWTGTHWAFVYVPADPANYHNEIAIRAASLNKLKTIYPAA